jgi:prepilin-type N-terminal cleavage/methylation domain-containing protein
MSALVRRAQAGFTLVELLIVVIILTVLAAIIVPQFSSATLDAREATLDSNLARVRSAIELYHAQHNSTYPGKAASTGATCPGGGTAGTGAADSTQALIDQMTMYSNVAGQTCSTSDGTFRFGPYLRKGFPVESVTDSSAISLVTAAGAVTPEGTNPGGWRYSTVTGQIIMNSGNNDSRGRAYSTH